MISRVLFLDNAVLAVWWHQKQLIRNWEKTALFGHDTAQSE